MTIENTQQEQQINYAAKPIEECLEVLESNSHSGLNLSQVMIRRAKFGSNELDLKPPESLLSRFVEQFQDPLILLLFASSFISFLIGEIADAISIALTILIVLTGSRSCVSKLNSFSCICPGI